jgi:diketogulonate reductase-like aldo/keto reductase
MRVSALLAAAPLLAAAAPADIPTVPVCVSSNRSICYNMPVVGEGSCCGTYNIPTWLSSGGRHIDTSCDYGSQPTIAAAVQASGIPRSQLWVTSKLNVESCASNMTAALYELVLNPLQMTYVDLLLIVSRRAHSATGSAAHRHLN